MPLLLRADVDLDLFPSTFTISANVRSFGGSLISIVDDVVELFDIVDDSGEESAVAFLVVDHRRRRCC
jgi:hypothetical protein